MSDRRKARYGDRIEGDESNYNWAAQFDLDGGYLGITQWADDKLERVLLSPKQVKVLTAFVASRGKASR